MRIEDVVEYFSQARVIDLSKKVTPGEAEGPLDTGKRRYEIKPFPVPPGEIMHNIEMESHISTHMEAPSHFVPVRHGRSAKDVSELMLTTFFGMAILVDCKDLAPKTAIEGEILEKFQIKEKDIVLIGKCRHQGRDRCYLAKEGVEYLVQKKIKLVGFDDTVFPENPEYGKDLNKYFTHDLMLSNEIPMIEGLANLGELKKERFLFFGFPAKMGGLESFPIRAVAIEGIE
ncbi:MAG: cyclase family protein [Desulfobacterales bacterium]|jgi:arylformamidase|nr:MAG: cyclase family protein [Desulfobacterales bacterium]